MLLKGRLGGTEGHEILRPKETELGHMGRKMSLERKRAKSCGDGKREDNKAGRRKTSLGFRD